MALRLLLHFLTLLCTVFAQRGRFEISCGPLPPQTTFDKRTSFIRNWLSDFFHITHPDCPDIPDTISFATWPTYSNNTHTHTAGFAYALSKCSARLAPRQFLLQDLLRYALFNPKLDLNDHVIDVYYHQNGSATYTFLENMSLPAEFLSWSVSGANVSVATPHLLASHTEDSLSQQEHDNQTMPLLEYNTVQLAHDADLRAYAKLLASSLDPNTLEFIGPRNKDTGDPVFSVTNASVHGTVHPVGTTNQYGHFEGFIKRDRPNISMAYNETLTLLLDSCDSPKTLSLPWLPNASDTFEHESPSLQAVSVETHGITIVSDIDDILRTTEIWNPKQMILNLFARPFRPWRSMPSVFWGWFHNDTGIHFHYATDAPETAYHNYVDGILSNYPHGSFSFRPLEFQSLAQTMNARLESIKALIETFPQRSYILIGDTATGTVLSAYIKLAEMFPHQVKCIYLRDVASTEPAQWISPAAKALKKVEKHVMFSHPAQLKNASQHALSQLALDSENFSHAECGRSLPGPAPTFKYDGFLTSWVKTEWKLWSEYFACFILVSHRSHRACVFDLRPGTGFYWGGPPQPEID